MWLKKFLKRVSVLFHWNLLKIRTDIESPWSGSLRVLFFEKWSKQISVTKSFFYERDKKKKVVERVWWIRKKERRACMKRFFVFCFLFWFFKKCFFLFLKIFEKAKKKKEIKLCHKTIYSFWTDILSFRQHFRKEFTKFFFPSIFFFIF